MDEVNWVARNMTVWTGQNSYKWVSDKDVKQAIRESMLKNGLSILPIGVIPKIKIDRWEEVDSYSKTWAMKTKQSIFTEVETRYLLLHTSGESIELSWYGQWVDTQDKGAGKATTYALKNTLLNMFLIPTGVDTDNTHSDDLPVPKKTVDTPTWWTKPKTFTSPNEYCPECWEQCETKKGKTKDWRDYEMWTCTNHTEDLKFFVNRKDLLNPWF